MIRWTFVWVALAILGCGAKKAPVDEGPLDVTFVVVGDTHFGRTGMLDLNQKMVEQINTLPGTDWPKEIGGKVAQPRGVLHMGDITDAAKMEAFTEFQKVWGLKGGDGKLKWPVFEATGNHDAGGDVQKAVRKRHEGLPYAWDWGRLRVICLDVYPDADGRKFLENDLKETGKDRPVIIYFHYCIDGPYGDWWKPEEKQAFAKAIEGYNVVAIFHGHYHMAGTYQWEGKSVYLPGSPRHACHTFLVVRITDDQFTAAWWDFDAKGWKGKAVARKRK